MKKIFLVLLLFGMFLTLTSCTQPSDTHIHVTPPIMPIDGVQGEIVAQGYVLIRDLPNLSETLISFHPYPGYFHLFPFAAWNGVPHLSITNSVDEFFELLGTDHEDIPTDYFGNQQLDNVTAVFDNFKHYVFDFAVDFVVVYAEITGIIDDWSGDEWEIVQPNFVLVTNGDSTIEPFQMQVGDEFLGLELIDIEWSEAFLKNGEIYYQLSAGAKVFGQVTLGGDLFIWLHFDSVEYHVRIEFSVANEYLSSLPRIADFGEGRNPIPIWNTEGAMRVLGITREELDTARNIELTEVTAILQISCLSSFGYDARFVGLYKGD